MPDYNETTAEGTKWQRCCKVIIDNPLNGIPTVSMQEEIAINIGGQTITQGCGGMSESFNPENPLHTDIYSKLNDLYVALRTARDEALSNAAVTPLPEAS